MPKGRGTVLVRDAAALREFERAEQLRQQAAGVESEVARLLAPLRERLSELILERDQLLYETLAARQKFFQAAKKAHPQLDTHRSLRAQARADKVYVRWDDTGPHFSTDESAELPQLHPFIRRRPGRRAWDLVFWLR